MEEAADAAADIAGWSFDLGLGAEVGGRGLEKFGSGKVAKFGVRLAGPTVSGVLFRASAISTAISLTGYAASGQTATALYNKGIEVAVDKTLGRFSGPAGKWLTDQVTSGAQEGFDANRCSK